MDITKEPIGELNDLVTIRLNPDDYAPQYEQSIRKARKQMNMPGFRAGHAPEGLVRKKYGKALLIEELNRIVSDSLDRYIREQQLRILGRPLPRDNGEANDFDAPGDFTFSFELGLAPTFDLKLPPDHTFPYYVISVEEKQVDDEVDWLRARYGSVEYPDVSDGECLLAIEAAEVDAGGQPVKDGFRTENRFRIEDLMTTALKDRFIGCRKEDRVIVGVPGDLEGADAAELFGVKQDALPGECRIEVLIREIGRRRKADLDQAFFDRVFGAGTVGGEEAFRARVREDIARSYRLESERKLSHDIEDELLHATAVVLPDAFLKRWLAEDDEKPLPPEEIEKKYGGWARAMKWKLISTRIEADNNLTVTDDEIETYARHYVAQRLAEYGGSYLTEEMIGQTAAQYLSREENKLSARDAVIHRKVFEWLNGIVKRKEQAVTIDEFKKILREHTHAH